MWFPVLIAVCCAIALLLMYAMLKSNELRVSRSLKMTGPALKSFEQVNDLRRMNAWNPFLKLDPRAKVVYEGSEVGVGAVCTWDGDANIGAGRQTIVESQIGERIRMKLEFYRPFVGTNDVEFTFVSEGNGTLVTWSMTGKLDFMPRLIGIFISMENMCGDSFNKGLADLKTIVEG